jgi:hypothetical protein
LPPIASPLLLCLALLAVAAVPASAATSLEAGGIGALDRSDIGIGGLVGLRFQDLRSGAAGSDFGLSAFANPGQNHSAWAGAILDLGVAKGVPLDSGTLFVPRLGFTALGAVGEGGGAAKVGLVGGLGVAALPERGVGVRLDGTLRWVFSPSELWLAVTLGLVWPGQKR